MTAVFECPECHHICEQTELRIKRPAFEGFEAEKEDILWQCDNCSVIYTERYRWQVEKRRRIRRERHQESGKPHILQEVQHGNESTQTSKDQGAYILSYLRRGSLSSNQDGEA